MTPIPITPDQIRAFRLEAHHLNQKLPFSGLTEAASVCGFQNSPPGAWETAAFCRLSDCTHAKLRDALYETKTLLQAWSYRGVPLVFPQKESAAFLTSLIPLAGETPWVYTLGISGALSFLGMSFDELLPLVREAVGCLAHDAVCSKELLDRTVAAQVRPLLPPARQPLWDAPSMYGDPARQTVGQAAVSFLLRPCSHLSLVVFGKRQKNSPTFTSYQNWLGQAFGSGEYPLAAESEALREAGRIFAKKFLHALGPSVPGDLAKWAGCPPRQAKRLWGLIAGELLPVCVEGKTRYLLQEDGERLCHAEADPQQLLLLGAHDPYLDLRDRAVILADQSLQRLAFKTVANPGAILRGGRIIGIWTTRTQSARLRIKLTLWETASSPELARLKALAEEYAAFRETPLLALEITQTRSPV